MNNISIFPVMVIRSGGLPLKALECPVFDQNQVESAWEQSNQLLLHLAAAWPDIFRQTLATLPESTVRTVVYNLSRKMRKQLATGFYTIIQYPVVAEIPVEFSQAVQEWNHAVATAADYQQRYSSHYSTVLKTELERLQHVAMGETLQRALLFTSHELLKPLPVWAVKSVDNFTKKDRQIARSVWQYAARATFKISPRSRFTTVGIWAKDIPNEQFHNPFNDNVSAAVKPKITPNVAILPLIYDALLKEPAFYKSLNIVLNPCIVDIQSKYYEWLYYDGVQESFQKTEATPGIDFVVNFFLGKSRSCPYTEILSVLAATVRDENQAEQFLFNLTDSGFVEWELPEKGLSDNWCNTLYNYLGWLSLEPVVIEAASLLQWLKTAARTLPFQTSDQAMETQKEAAAVINGFLRKYRVQCPVFTPEQIFLEDVAHLQEKPGYAEALSEWSAQLVSITQTLDGGVLLHRPLLHGCSAVARAKISQYFREHYGSDSDVPFLEFCQRYMDSLQPAAGQANEQALIDDLFKKNITQSKFSYQLNNSDKKNNTVKIGALLQPFTENGQIKAVVNAIYPGGGKLLSRWLHLFNTEVKAAMQHWNTAPDATPFPWQHWSNAAFQPDIGSKRVLVPGNRLSVPPSATKILLGNVGVKDSKDGLQLFDRASGVLIQFADLGVEALDSRPPVMQLLLSTGSNMPFIEIEGEGWERVGEEGEAVAIIEKRNRIVFDDLVLSRAAWRISSYPWQAPTTISPPPNAVRHPAFSFYALRKCLRQWDIPRYFFVQPLTIAVEKPQYIDQESTISMQIFEKIVKQHGEKGLLLTEMLPTPDACLGERAEEVAIEVARE